MKIKSCMNDYFRRKGKRLKFLRGYKQINNNILMNELYQIIITIQKQLVNLYSENSDEIESTNDLLNSLSDDIKLFEEKWVGGWGQTNYNIYKLPYNGNSKVDDEYIYSYLEHQ